MKAMLRFLARAVIIPFLAVAPMHTQALAAATCNRLIAPPPVVVLNPNRPIASPTARWLGKWHLTTKVAGNSFGYDLTIQEDAARGPGHLTGAFVQTTIGMRAARGSLAGTVSSDGNWFEMTYEVPDLAPSNEAKGQGRLQLLSNSNFGGDTFAEGHDRNFAYGSTWTGEYLGPGGQSAAAAAPRFNPVKRLGVHHTADEPAAEPNAPRVDRAALHAVTVKLDVDVYAAAGGAGQPIAQLSANTQNVELVQACQNNWCHVRWPGHEGWVYSGPDYDSLGH